MSAAGVLTVIAVWIVIDNVVEQRLRATPVDADPEALPQIEPPGGRELRALCWALLAAIALAGLIAAAAYPPLSSLRAADGKLTGMESPVIKSIVPFGIQAPQLYP